MATESGGDPVVAAQAQLAALDRATQASERAQFIEPSKWVWRGVAFAGPAGVWWTSRNLDPAGATESRLLTIGAIVFGTIALASVFIALRMERRSPVRGRSPAQGGPTSRWRFLATFSFTLAFVVGVNLPSINEVFSPYLLGAAVYLVMALVPVWFERRHIAAAQP